MTRTHRPPAHERTRSFDAAVDLSAACAEACAECARASAACAERCRDEPSRADLGRCARLAEDCADLCAATGRVVARALNADSEVVRLALEACISACAACAAETQSLAGSGPGCGECAEACRRCERACRALLAGGRAEYEPLMRRDA